MDDIFNDFGCREGSMRFNLRGDRSTGLSGFKNDHREESGREQDETLLGNLKDASFSVGGLKINSNPVQV